jgi:hypothetical protein
MHETKVSGTAHHRLLPPGPIKGEDAPPATPRQRRARPARHRHDAASRPHPAVRQAVRRECSLAGLVENPLTN